MFNRSLNASEVIALSAQLGESWHVSAKDSTCDENRLKPGTPPTHRCTGTETTLAGAGPSNATIARLTKFVAATSEPSLHVSAKLVYRLPCECCCPRNTELTPFDSRVAEHARCGAGAACARVRGGLA